MTVLPGGTHVGRVGLAVGDREAVASFYEDVVGLEEVDRGDGHTALGTGGEALLSVRAAPELPPRPASAAGLFHVAYRVPTRAALAAALGRLRPSGRLTGASDHLVSEALYARDPEGNGVECYRDRPREEWERTGPPDDPDAGVRIDTLPLDLDDLASAGDGEAATVPPGTDVGHVHLEVTDLDRARAFYVDALGFDVMARMSGALFVAAGGYHHHVGLNIWNGRTEPATGRGLDHVELVIPDDDALAAARDRLADAGFPVQEREAGATVEDPDGNEVRLVGPA